MHYSKWQEVSLNSLNKAYITALKAHKRSISTWRTKIQKLMTFKIDLRLFVNAYLSDNSTKVNEILVQDNRHEKKHFSCRKYFKIRIGKVRKQTTKTVHAPFRTTGHCPWPLVEETIITFKPPPRNLRSLYRWIRIEKTKNPTRTEKFISSPINTVLTKRLPQKISKQGTSFSQIFQRIKQPRIHTPKPNLNIVLNVCMTLNAWTMNKEKV